MLQQLQLHTRKLSFDAGTRQLLQQFDTVGKPSRGIEQAVTADLEFDLVQHRDHYTGYLLVERETSRTAISSGLNSFHKAIMFS